MDITLLSYLNKLLERTLNCMCVLCSQFLVDDGCGGGDYWFFTLSMKMIVISEHDITSVGVFGRVSEHGHGLCHT